MKLEDAIGRIEGYGKPGTVPTRDNNIGDIRAGAFAAAHGAIVDAHGCIHDRDGMAHFATPQAGYAALVALLHGSSYKSLTVAQTINRYAPPSENNTSNYVHVVCGWLGCTPDTPIASLI